jgi:ribosome assembly protein 1
VKDGAFLKKLQLAFSEDSDYDWPLNVIHRILAFGPNNNGPNVLLNQSLLQPHTSGEWAASQPMLNSIKFGFQIATNHGPLCEEPMRGVCFVINAFTYDSSIEKSSCGPIGGTLINASKDLCRKAFLRGHPRLMQAVYSCEIHAQAEVLGKIYSVISKRAGQVYSEEMKEGTSLFLVKCYLPVINSFGFVEEIRKKASGSANPQLVLDHWQILPIDPFWTPSTEEELILFGKKFDGENIARKYMNDVRRRKGLPS